MKVHRFLLASPSLLVLFAWMFNVNANTATGGPGQLFTKVFVSSAACKALTSGITYGTDFIKASGNNKRISCPIFHTNWIRDIQVIGGYDNCTIVNYGSSTSPTESPLGSGESNGRTSIECVLDDNDRFKGYSYLAGSLFASEQQQFSYSPLASCAVQGNHDYELHDNGNSIGGKGRVTSVRCPLISHDNTSKHNPKIRAFFKVPSSADTPRCYLRSIDKYGEEYDVEVTTTITSSNGSNKIMELEWPNEHFDYLEAYCDIDDGVTFRGFENSQHIP